LKEFYYISITSVTTIFSDYLSTT
ncbi:hypothetical protein A5815_002555, partial [Enterococcus faecium]